MALIQTISQRNSARSQPLTVRDTNSMGSRTQRDTFGSKGSLSSQSTSRVHTQSKKYNYYLGEDFV